MRIRCYVIALATILVPASLWGKGTDMFRMGGEPDVYRKLGSTKGRNEVEENWIRQYRAVRSSESERSGFESTRTPMVEKDAGSTTERAKRNARERAKESTRIRGPGAP